MGNKTDSRNELDDLLNSLTVEGTNSGETEWDYDIKHVDSDGYVPDEEDEEEGNMEKLFLNEEDDEDEEGDIYTEGKEEDEFGFLEAIGDDEEESSEVEFINLPTKDADDTISALIEKGLFRTAQQDEELEIRELIDKRRIEIDDDLDNDVEVKEALARIEEEEAKQEMDINSAIPNIPVEELNDYILIKGMYSSAFKEFISSDILIPPGDYPVAIEIEGNLILFKKINPEPKTLYYLKRVLKKFSIEHIENGEVKELDMYAFLGKTPLTL